MKVIYVHFGKIPEYLKKSINLSCQKNQVILLTDDLSYKNEDISIFNSQNYYDGLDNLRNVYEHFSYLDPTFEFICIFRWFVLRNFFNKHNLDYAYYSDSDVMIYYDLQPFYEKYYSQYDACYVTTENQKNYRWSSSACCSFWKKESINKFCEFILSCYSPEKIHVIKDKWDYHVTNSIPGGICDMTLLYLFQDQIYFFPLSKVIEDFAFDQNMKDKNNYYDNEYDYTTVKKINFVNGFPQCFNKKYNKDIKFLTLVEYAKMI